MEKAGRTVTVSGPIGSGKTTVARLLVAFLRTRGFGVELGEMPELDRTNLSKEPVAELLSDTMAPWWPVRVEVRSTDEDEFERKYEEVRSVPDNHMLFPHLEETWLPRLMHHGASVDGFVERPSLGQGRDGEDRRRYRIYTSDHCYVISAVVKAYGGTYLGCVVSARKPRAGEKYARGNDLPDGEFNYDTWLRIVHAIVGYELVPLERSEPPVEDEEEAQAGQDQVAGADGSK